MENLQHNLTEYIGVKVVGAMPMTRKEYNDFRGWIVPENENPTDEGYLVVYNNSDPQPELVGKVSGYASWSPKATFESAYRKTQQEKFSFEIALTQLKVGNKIARSGWNGKGMYLFLVNGNSVKSAIHSAYGDPNVNLDVAMDVCDAIYMKTADNKLVPWLASQTDILADDWTIVP